MMEGPSSSSSIKYELRRLSRQSRILNQPAIRRAMEILAATFLLIVINILIDLSAGDPWSLSVTIISLEQLNAFSMALATNG